jgi:hypothetical protein
MARNTPPTTKMKIRPGMMRSTYPDACGAPLARGAGKGSPSITRMIRSTPARMPP